MRAAFPRSKSVNKVPVEYRYFVFKNKTNDKNHFRCPTDDRKRITKKTIVDHFHKCDACENYFAEHNLDADELWNLLGLAQKSFDDVASDCSDLSNVSGAKEKMTKREREAVEEALRKVREQENKAKRAATDVNLKVRQLETFVEVFGGSADIHDVMANPDVFFISPEENKLLCHHTYGAALDAYEAYKTINNIDSPDFIDTDDEQPRLRA
jgi:hypothetical protein